METYANIDYTTDNFKQQLKEAYKRMKSALLSPKGTELREECSVHSQLPESPENIYLKEQEIPALLKPQPKLSQSST